MEVPKLDNGDWSSLATTTTETPSLAALNTKPKILLMGLPKSGKSSIRHVIFHKMSANETQFLDPTPRIDKIDISTKSFLDFQLWDFPGKLDITHHGEVFSEARVLIFVIDPVEEQHSRALERLHSTILEAYKVSPRIKVEVFIHKSDTLNEDQRNDYIRDMTQRIHKKLVQTGLQDLVNISFKTTSIYDHSIFEAMSIVCQQLLENVLLPFESILNSFVTSNKMEKAFIFDLHPKIFIATDSTSTFDMPNYELCCDMLDLIADMACIYQEQEGAESSYSTCSVVRLNDSLLHLKQINKHLAVVCIQQQDMNSSQGILDYNFSLLKDGIEQVISVANL